MDLVPRLTVRDRAVYEALRNAKRAAVAEDLLNIFFYNCSFAPSSCFLPSCSSHQPVMSNCSTLSVDNPAWRCCCVVTNINRRAGFGVVGHTLVPAADFGVRKLLKWKELRPREATLHSFDFALSLFVFFSQPHLFTFSLSL